MSDKSIATVKDLISLLNNAEPLSASRINQLYSSYQSQETIDFSLSERAQQDQLRAINKRKQEYQSSLRYKLWSESLSKENQNNLHLHAHLTIELFKHFKQSGDVPPPASPWRIAVLLSKEKELELEREFLVAWAKHFGNVIGKKYEQLKQRLNDIEK